MFWGLVVKPGKRYESVVANAFRLNKACLEPSTAGGKVCMFQKMRKEISSRSKVGNYLPLSR